MGKRPRHLLEQVTSSAPLRVDEVNGVIFRVKVLGRFSANSHGMAGATNGTDYGPCMAKARSLYEGQRVKADHPERGKAAHPRSVTDTLGVLKNVVVEGDERGEPAVWADLHCLTTHPLAPRVIEDAKKGMGAFGLSHNASSLPSGERLDRANRRLVIEELAVVRSVDLVDRPATNRTLWESQSVKTTLRELIEDLKLTPRRAKRRKALLEDAGMGAPLDAPMDAPPADADPAEGISAAFKAAIMSVIDGAMSRNEDPKAALKKVKKLLDSHGDINGDGVVDDADLDAADDADDADEEKTEAVKELARTKHKLAVRELCEEMGVTADKTLLGTLEDLSVEKGRKLLEREKARGTGARPRASGHTGTRPVKKATGQSFVDAITQ
jgi:hypothetical protein